MLSDPSSETITDAPPRPTGFVAIPSATTRGDSANEILTANASESRERVQQMSHGWKEDAKSVLIFVSPVQRLLSSIVLI
jgi:hypothetical protein